MAKKKNPNVLRGIKYAASEYRKGGRKFGRAVKAVADNLSNRKGYYQQTMPIQEGFKQLKDALKTAKPFDTSFRKK